MFNTVLVANRGEIALRVVRTCRELGIRTVVVYSSSDADSAAVRAADEAVRIGPPPAGRSYLNVPAVISAARNTGAEAIHPGYGFLSEDADFAEICADNGLVFVGPPPDVMARLSDKADARRIMADAGLPVLEGSQQRLESAAEARAEADRIGYPVIIKAAAGGGGRGMAVVRDRREFPAAYQRTRAHAQAVFGDSGVYLERFVESARHVEVQVLADAHGTTVHLGERDCSVQRRQQKLVEETPAPGLPTDLTEQICAAAVRGAAAVGYTGVGTFEFLVDSEGRFTFMEVNCRIQVEHPVTEMVTGLDLVAEQLSVAAGRPLSLGQADVERRGVAIECRVNAEDPDRGFAPTPGLLTEYVPPGGPFVRVDTHGYAGLRISADYDPLLAKLVVWAPDRAGALSRMDRALAEFRIRGEGVATTAGFLREVLARPLFRDAKHTTALVEQMLAERAVPTTAS